MKKKSEKWKKCIIDVYKRQVQSFCNINGVVYYSAKEHNALAGVTNLKTPTMQAATVSSNGQVNVSWTPVENAQEYRVYRKVAGGGWVRIATVGNTSYTDSTAAAGTTYYYTVRATCTWDGQTYLSGYHTQGIAAR